MPHMQAQTGSESRGLPLMEAAPAERAELLLERCARRDERALRELYQLIAPQLLGVLVRILRRRAVAEEALQDVMVRIWERADQYVAYRGRAMAWMVAIARYRAIDLLRAQQAATPLDDVPPDALADRSATDFFDSTTPERLRKALRDCLGLLSDEQRRCLALAYVDGYSQDQIASAIQSPLGTVKSWMRRGLTSLKRCLDS
ncbi:MAG TPA: sigma-70 family RNA polymerase sigma factor [Povalibacter sp.]|nr:sigma-70 family RNA polymerase sigma factor [Povalibacter sp.]